MDDLQEQRKKIQETLQLLQKQQEEVKEELLAQTALIGEGVSDMARLIGYDEGGEIHRRVDWRLNLIIKRHKKRYPKEKLIIAFECFRGYGKSTLYNRVNLIKRCIKEPLKSRLIGSSKRALAADMLTPIKRILKGNPRIRKHYPNMVGTLKWSTEEILVAPAESMENPDNNYTIETWGVDAAVASKRFHEIYIDDIIGKDNIVNSRLLDMAAKGFKLLLPLLHPGGILFIMYMRWGIHDWYKQNVLEAFKDSKHFHLIRVPDIECNDAGKPLNKYGEIVSEDSPERIPSYPEKYSLSYLDEERKLLGDMYWSHYRQHPRKTENKLMDSEMLVTIPDDEYKMIVDKVRTGVIPRQELKLFVDNANTVSKQSNPWSITLWRYNGITLDLLFFRKTKFSLDAAATELAKLAQYFALDEIHGEKSGLLGNLQFYLRQKLNQMGLINTTLIDESHEGINKKVRILSMQPFINIGVVRVPELNHCWYPLEMDGERVNQLKLLKNEMELYPQDGTNIPDDLIDSFGFVPKMFNIETDYFDPSVMEGKKKLSREEQIKNETERRHQVHDPNLDSSEDIDYECGEEVEFL